MGNAETCSTTSEPTPCAIICHTSLKFKLETKTFLISFLSSRQHNSTSEGITIHHHRLASIHESQNRSDTDKEIRSAHNRIENIHKTLAHAVTVNDSQAPGDNDESFN